MPAAEPDIFSRNFLKEALEIVETKSDAIPVERVHLFALYHHMRAQIETLEAALEDDSYNRAVIAELHGRKA